MSPELQKLIHLLSRLPGLGPRSGRRVALHLLKKRDVLFQPLMEALQNVSDTVRTCTTCFNLDTRSPCGICTDALRQHETLCVVADVADLWAIERTSSFKGRYHVLGGILSAIDGVGPEDLTIEALVERVRTQGIKEVILALNSSLDGQTTSFYLIDLLQPLGVQITRLAQGVPLGGELDYLDDGTILTALKSRQSV